MKSAPFRFTLFLFIFLSCLFFACGQKRDKAQMEKEADLELEKIPAVVMDGLKASFPKAEIQKWTKEKEGDIETKVKSIPEGIGTGRAEAPRGEVFHFVKTNGSNYPERHKIRAPSYVNIATFRKSCIGQTISDATIALAAVDPCYCCTERLASVYDSHTGMKMFGGEELVMNSQRKTNELRKE